MEREAWDGEWYKRAFFDDGTPLGSAQNDECQIDSIAQSWAVLSGAGDPDRARQAMESVERRLVRQDDRLLLLFSPPFDQTERDPGYIKGYLPGIRENGGQYTHAAIWSVMAFARLGDGDKSFDLFNLLNPIHHASRRASAHRYKVEPYAVAADIYSAPAHSGTGRMDVVHGCGGLALPRGPGVDSRIPKARFRSHHRSVHSSRLETLRDRLSSRRDALSDRGRESGRRLSRCFQHQSRRDPRFRARRSFPSPTTASNTGSRSCSDRYATEETHFCGFRQDSDRSSRTTGTTDSGEAQWARS